jgi:hypothetical protein
LYELGQKDFAQLALGERLRPIRQETALGKYPATTVLYRRIWIPGLQKLLVAPIQMDKSIKVTCICLTNGKNQLPQNEFYCWVVVQDNN